MDHHNFFSYKYSYSFHIFSLSLCYCTAELRTVVMQASNVPLSAICPSIIHKPVFFFQTPFSELKPWNLKPNLGGKLYIYPPSRSTISPDHLFFQNLFIYFFIIFFKFSFNMKTYGSKNVKRHPWKYTSDSLPKNHAYTHGEGFYQKCLNKELWCRNFKFGFLQFFCVR